MCGDELDMVVTTQLHTERRQTSIDKHPLMYVLKIDSQRSHIRDKIRSPEANERRSRTWRRH